MENKGFINKEGRYEKMKKGFRTIFFYIEGEELLKVNGPVETLRKMDEKVNNVVELRKRRESTIWENMKKLL